jgi:hypothetical protein
VLKWFGLDADLDVGDGVQRIAGEVLRRHFPSAMEYRAKMRATSAA